MQCALRKANLFCGDFVHGLLDAGEIGIAFSQRNVAHAAVAFVFGDIGIGLGHITACLQFYLAGALSLYSTWLTSDHSMPIELVSDTIESAIESSVFPSVVIA